MLYRGD
ncbi:unnamed protein product [Linum tenue]|nr:unnamed protein product [Linum tenue]